MLDRRTLAAFGSALIFVASGCGGSVEKDKRGEKGPDCERLKAESQREECERAKVAQGIPVVNRVAYYQLATTAGLLRGRAVAVSRGEPQPRTAGAEELRAARARVEKTRPSDKGLKGLRTRVLSLLQSEAGGLGRDEARAILVKLDGVTRSLNAFLKHEPGQAALVPD